MPAIPKYFSNNTEEVPSTGNSPWSTGQQGASRGQSQYATNSTISVGTAPCIQQVWRTVGVGDGGLSIS